MTQILKILFPTENAPVMQSGEITAAGSVFFQFLQPRACITASTNQIVESMYPPLRCFLPISPIRCLHPFPETNTRSPRGPTFVFFSSSKASFWKDLHRLPFAQRCTQHLFPWERHALSRTDHFFRNNGAVEFSLRQIAQSNGRLLERASFLVRFFRDFGGLVVPYPRRQSRYKHQ